LKPGTIGIKFCPNGQVTGLTKKAQQALHAGEVNQHWKIIKIDSEKFTKDILMKKASGSKDYTIEFVCTGNFSSRHKKPVKFSIFAKHLTSMTFIYAFTESWGTGKRSNENL
jgi:hypothetical protein